MSKELRLPSATVARVKQMIASGEKQNDVSRKCGISQPMVSRIKSGGSYSEVPWPNGRVGSYVAAYRNENAGPLSEQGWSPYAVQFMEWPDEYQGWMTKAVNDRRASEGRPPIPTVSVAWEAYMRSPHSDDPQKDAQRAEVARQAEDHRRSTVMREFEGIRQELSDKKKDALLDEVRKLASTEVSTYESPPNTIDPAACPHVPWTKEVEEAHPICKQALREKDALKMEAICILFAEVREKDWGEEFIPREVGRIRAMLVGLPTALEDAEKLYAHLITPSGV